MSGRCALGWVVVWMLAPLGCGGGPPELGNVGQPIINGTLAPTLVSLTAGEQLAIGYLSQGNGDPFCTATLIANDFIN